MKVFIWYVDQCSNDYHSDGGVVVFAETEQRARELANMEDGCAIRDDEHPRIVREASGPEYVEIFPNAGCC